MMICLSLYLISFLTYVLIRNNIISININKGVLKKAGMVFLGVLTIAFLMELNNQFTDSTITQIRRNDYGQGVETGTYRVQIDGKEEETLDIQVAPRAYTEAELLLLSLARPDYRHQPSLMPLDLISL